MGSPKLLRYIVGTIAVIVVGFLFYAMWRLYAYFYLERKIKREGTKRAEPPPPPKETYRRPRVFYDKEKHEFYFRDEELLLRHS